MFIISNGWVEEAKKIINSKQTVVQIVNYWNMDCNVSNISIVFECTYVRARRSYIQSKTRPNDILTPRLDTPRPIRVVRADYGTQNVFGSFFTQNVLQWPPAFYFPKCGARLSIWVTTNSLESRVAKRILFKHKNDRYVTECPSI